MVHLWLHWQPRIDKHQDSLCNRQEESGLGDWVCLMSLMS